MSTALISGVIAVVAAAGTVVGLEVSGVVSNISGDAGGSHTSLVADADSDSPEVLRERIDELEKELTTLRETTAKQSNLESISSKLNTKLKSVEEVAYEARDMASRQPKVVLDTTPSEPVASNVEEADLTEMVNEAIALREEEEARLKAEEKERKAAENREKARAKFIESAEKKFRAQQEKQGLSEFQVTEAVAIVTRGYDANVGYMQDVKNRREQGLEVAPSEIKSERDRIKSETDESLKLLFSKEEWNKFEKSYKTLSLWGDGGDRGGRTSPRGSTDSPRGGASPRGGGRR